MEIPKDYSSVYREERTPVPATRGASKSLDGSFAPRRHRESGKEIDFNELKIKLTSLSEEQHKAYAIKTLQQHYDENIVNRKSAKFKVCIEYFGGKDGRERYVVGVDRNTLRDVKHKMPIKGDFRVFVFHARDQFEEVEDDNTILPYHENEGRLNIHCRVFPR